MLRTGEQVGPYTLTNKLGQGAFGTVWLAERRTAIAVTQVALKIHFDDNANLSAIKKEAAVWAKASGHPNVLPIIEADIFGDRIVIVSEYAPNGSLEDAIRRRGENPVHPGVAAELVAGILAGLEHLHARGIVHRDIKPANILLQGKTPRLADFGISRVLKATSQSGVMAGTPLYMAPEAFDGKRSEQSDVWSVGVILYQLLAGRMPFAQPDVSSLIAAIIHKEPPPLPPTVNKHLRDVVAKALHKDLSQRFKSAAEMRGALSGQAIMSAPPVARPGAASGNQEPLKTRETPTQNTKKGKVSFVVAAVALVAIFASLGFWKYQVGKTETSTSQTAASGSSDKVMLPNAVTLSNSKYSGSVGAEPCAFKLSWNENSTVIGSYSPLSSPEIVYTLLGTNFREGEVEIKVYQGTNQTGIMSLKKKIAEGKVCWAGPYTANDGDVSPVNMCRLR